MAQKFRKIDPRIWRDEKFIRLNAEEKLVALYCLTAQSNRCGIFVFSPAMAAEELGVTLPRTFLERFGRVVSALGWGWDEYTRVLYFPTWWKYNPPESKNVLLGNLKDVDDLPSSPLLESFYSNTAYLPEGLRQTLLERYPQPYPKPCPNQEQEQEQEQDGRDRPKNGFKKPSLEEVTAYCRERRNSIDPQRFIDHYTANGWRVGKSSMKDWRAAVRTWEKNEFANGKSVTVPDRGFTPPPDFGNLPPMNFGPSKE